MIERGGLSDHFVIHPFKMTDGPYVWNLIFSVLLSPPNPKRKEFTMAINKEIIEGNVESAFGTAQAKVGEVFGDTSTQVDGKIHELKGKAEQAYGKAKDAYDKASETVKDWAEKAPETAREARERAQKIAEEGSAKVRQTVQEQPVAVLAGGIALGFVIGWLLSGRKN